MPDHRPLRVGYVVKRYPRYSETFIVNEILAHESAGLEIEIFALRPPNDRHFQDRIGRVRAPVHYIPDQRVRANPFWAAMTQAAEVYPHFWQNLEDLGPVSGDDLHQSLLLALAAKSQGITHFHAHFASVAATISRIASRLSQIPFTFTAHAKDIFHEDVSAVDLQQKLDDASAVITVSEFNREYLGQRFPTAAGRVRRVYNGLELSAFPYSRPDNRPLKIVSVGRLVEKKGFADLVQACGLLAQRRVAFHCSIIGTGDLHAVLAQSINDLGLREQVELVGARPQAEVIEAVRDAAVFAAPCVVGEDGNRDGLPTVLLEAMALGTPCVSTPVTGIPEVVKDGETGVMVPQRNPEALAAAIERLFDNAALRVQLAERARKMMEQQFDVHANAAVIREVWGQGAAAEVCPAPAHLEAVGGHNQSSHHQSSDHQSSHHAPRDERSSRGA